MAGAFLPYQDFYVAGKVGRARKFRDYLVTIGKQESRDLAFTVWLDQVW